MVLVPGNVYHLFNRGINRQPLFFQERNYAFFAAKLEKHLAPHCQILAWCLMPNHIHILLTADHRSVLKTASGRSLFEEGLRILLSSYTRGINKQENRVGNLFQQNTRYKCVWDAADFRGSGYVARCIRYLHDNPGRPGWYRIGRTGRGARGRLMQNRSGSRGWQSARV